MILSFYSTTLSRHRRIIDGISYNTVDVSMISVDVLFDKESDADLRQKAFYRRQFE